MLLGDDGPDGWGIKYTREFDMTNDSHLFPPRPEWEAKGYRPDEYSGWLLGDWRLMEELWEMLGVDPSKPEPAEIELEDWLFDTTAGPERREAEAQFVHGHLLKPGDVARTDWKLRCAQPPYDRLPVARVRIPAGIVLSREADAWIAIDGVRHVAVPFFEGRMIGQFDFCEKGWVSGKGRSAVWRRMTAGSRQIHPQYLMAKEHVPFARDQMKVAIMDITSSTNTRTMIASALAGLPCGHSIGVLKCSAERANQISAALNSYVYDFALRVRFSGLHNSWFMLEETPLPLSHRQRTPPRLSGLAAYVGAPDCVSWTDVSSTEAPLPVSAVTEHERLRSAIALDVLIAASMDLNTEDFAHVLRQCDLPATTLTNANLESKGFWRVDKDRLPELRQSVLTLVAFHDLTARIHAAGGSWAGGVESFLTQNNGEGWLLPETLSLADYDLGQDARADHPQQVASRLGPRFCDWQLAQNAENRRRENRLHTRNLLGSGGDRELMHDRSQRSGNLTVGGFDKGGGRNPGQSRLFA